MLPDFRVFIAALLVTVGFVFLGFALMAMLRSAQVATVTTHTPRSPVVASGPNAETQPPAAEMTAIDASADSASPAFPENRIPDNDIPAAQPAPPDAAATPGLTEPIDRAIAAAAPAEAEPAGRLHAGGAATEPEPAEPAPGAAASAPALVPAPSADNAKPRGRPPTEPIPEAADVTGSLGAPSQSAEASGQKQDAKAGPRTKSKAAKRARAGNAAVKRAQQRARAAAAQTAPQGPFSDLFQTQPPARPGASMPGRD